MVEGSSGTGGGTGGSGGIGGSPTVREVSAEDCELCEAARFTHWYAEDDVCWVADCEACDCPMVVWKQHGVDAPEPDVEHMVAALTQAAVERFGEGGFSIDRVMRQMPWHFHAHARDRGWQQRRWTSQPSRYSGRVGGPRVLIGSS